MDELEAWNARVAQYDAPPAPGMRRFWVSVETWKEEWKPDRFFTWTTGSGSDYRIKASFRADPANSDLVDKLSDATVRRGLSEERFEEIYICNAMVCMLVDAPDEAAAWRLVREQFPDGVERFCEAADDMTLTTLAAGGRFGLPQAIELDEASAPSP